MAGTKVRVHGFTPQRTPYPGRVFTPEGGWFRWDRRVLDNVDADKRNSDDSDLHTRFVLFAATLPCIFLSQSFQVGLGFDTTWQKQCREFRF